MPPRKFAVGQEQVLLTSPGSILAVQLILLRFRALASPYRRLAPIPIRSCISNRGQGNSLVLISLLRVRLSNQSELAPAEMQFLISERMNDGGRKYFAARKHESIVYVCLCIFGMPA